MADTQDRLAKFYPLETMRDRPFAKGVADIIDNSLQVFLSVTLSSRGASYKPCKLVEPHGALLANLAIAEALGVLPEDIAADIYIIHAVAKEFGQASSSKRLEAPHIRTKIDQIRTLETLDSLAGADRDDLHIRVLRMNLDSGRDRLRMAARMIDAWLEENGQKVRQSVYARTHNLAPAVCIVEDDRVYGNALTDFERAMSAMTSASNMGSGRPSETLRIYWASVLLTRLCSISMSLDKLLPGGRLASRDADDVWDYASIASLTRAAVECYILYFYIAIEDVPEPEWRARQWLMFIHDCRMRLEIRYAHQPDDGRERSFYLAERSRIGNMLSQNTYFASLSEKRRVHLLKGQELFFVERDVVISKMDIDVVEFKKWYMFLSADVHSFPFSFYSATDEERGRGLESRAEKQFIANALQFVVTFIERATREYHGMFPDLKDEKTNPEQGSYREKADA